MKNLLFILCMLILSPVYSQGVEVEMADKFREDGKIYVVIIVVGIILTGLFTYLILLDRKIRKIEKDAQVK